MKDPIVLEVVEEQRWRFGGTGRHENGRPGNASRWIFGEPQ